MLAYATTTLRPDGSDDPNSPVALGNILITSSELAPGQQVQITIENSARTIQQWTETAGDAGSINSTVAIDDGLLNDYRGLGSSQFSEAQCPCLTGNSAVSVMFELLDAQSLTASPPAGDATSGGVMTPTGGPTPVTHTAPASEPAMMQKAAWY